MRIPEGVSVVYSREGQIAADAPTVVLIPGSNCGIRFKTARQAGQKGITVIATGGRGNEAADSTRKLQESSH